MLKKIQNPCKSNGYLFNGIVSIFVRCAKTQRLHNHKSNQQEARLSNSQLKATFNMNKMFQFAVPVYLMAEEVSVTFLLRYGNDYHCVNIDFCRRLTR